MNNPNECDPENGFVYSEPADKLRSLILDSTAQLQPETEFEELYDQVIKNLVFVARLLKITSTEHENENKEEENNKSELSLLWLLKRLRKCINLEVSQAPRSTVVVSVICIDKRHTSFFRYCIIELHVIFFTENFSLQMDGWCNRDGGHRVSQANTFPLYVSLG